MIGPPGIPKSGRKVFSSAAKPPVSPTFHPAAWRWIAGLYVAGILAHFSHHMAFDLPSGTDPTFREALASAPTSLVWPADLIGTLIDLT